MAPSKRSSWVIQQATHESNSCFTSAKVKMATTNNFSPHLQEYTTHFNIVLSIQTHVSQRPQNQNPWPCRSKTSHSVPRAALWQLNSNIRMLKQKGWWRNTKTQEIRQHPVTSKPEILFFSNNKRRTNSALLSIQNPWLSQTQKDQWLQLNRPHILPTQWQETVLTITCWNTLQAPVFKTCNHSQKTFQIHKPFLILAWLKLMMLLNKQNRFSHPLPRKCHHPPQTQSDDHRDSPNPQHTFIITWLEFEMIHMIKVITEKSCSDQYFSYYFLKWSLLWFCFM